ncbi:MAG TPA: 2-oxoglutarate dehydrogenase E1 component [Polyangiales bacterium]|nr:2-oxoglutarate dehydrogenase E1 component [Polyangiales bacterium]
MDFGINQSLVEELYLRFSENPHSVESAWQKYFEHLTDAERAGLLTQTNGAAGARFLTNGNGASNGGATTVNGLGNGHAAAYAKSNGTTNGANGNGHAVAAVVEYAATSPGISVADSDLQKDYQERVTALVNGYRLRGHRFAQLDPLNLANPENDELSLERFGLDQVDPNTMFATGNFAGPPQLPLKDFVHRLQETYCRTIGVEYRNIEEPEIRGWLQERMESSLNRIDLTHDQQVRILSKLIDAEIFEQFLHTKYVGAKRFSLEGTESIIPMLELVIDSADQHGIEEMVIGMAHRGRLNVLANVMEKSLKEIFAAFEDENPELLMGRGDVKYHLGYSSDRTLQSGRSLHLTLAFNPSHLEYVNPVVEGRVRAKQDRRGDKERRSVLPLLIHGDAAFIGQGVVAETLNMSGLRGYSTGGTVHIVVNNQIGFTTVWQDSRSSRYCTDVARMLRCPVFHVNGEDPEAVAQVVHLSMDYRQRYGRDVVIDLYGYRRYGHNEADEPRFTQPVMYAAVDQKPSVREVYVKALVEAGKFTQAHANELEQARKRVLEADLEEVRKTPFVPPQYSMQGLWAGYKGGPDAETPDVETWVAKPKLQDLLTRVTEVPKDFTVHPKLKRFLEQRREQRDGKRPLDWGTGETLAYASLVADGTPVRLSGQDSRRGTFSHRHAVLHDSVNGKLYTPLAYLAKDQGRFEVWDSPLSEAAVLGFEYGLSLDTPEGLTIWEAQFGDFANGAQVLIDQFLSSSEDKWYRLSGLVLLLPHGFEGQGPEHSSARLERWLNLCAEDNMQVCNLTTPAQFFHVLRRQVLRPYRKPLIIMSPKSLLRSPLAVSSLDELSQGSAFQRIIPDQANLDPTKVKRVLMCSGKVYYDLANHRTEYKREDVAILRAEQIYPLRKGELDRLLKPYADGTQLVWVQEEPWNMGAWYYMQARLPGLVGNRFPLSCVSRPESASPATGSMSAHKLEQEHLMQRAFAGLDG